MVKNLPAWAGDPGLIHGLGRAPGVGNGNPLYSCLRVIRARSLAGCSPWVPKVLDMTEMNGHSRKILTLIVCRSRSVLGHFRYLCKMRAKDWDKWFVGRKRSQAQAESNWRLGRDKPCCGRSCGLSIHQCRGFFRAPGAGFEVGVSKLFSSVPDNLAEETDSNGISSWLWR